MSSTRLTFTRTGQPPSVLRNAIARGRRSQDCGQIWCVRIRIHLVTQSNPLDFSSANHVLRATTKRCRTVSIFLHSRAQISPDCRVASHRFGAMFPGSGGLGSTNSRGNSAMVKESALKELSTKVGNDELVKRLKVRCSATTAVSSRFCRLRLSVKLPLLPRCIACLR
jgi:hypothetical protein